MPTKTVDKSKKSATAKKVELKSTGTKASASKAPVAKAASKPTANKVTAGKSAGAKTKATASKAVSVKKPAKSVKNVLPKSGAMAVPAVQAKARKKSDPLETFERVSNAVAKQEMDLLCKRYPDADCELDFDTPFQLITAVIMSAQTTDTNVNKVTKNLFRKYPDAKALSKAPLDDIKDIIRSTGFFNAKATNIQNCAKALVERFGGEVPSRLEDLITLPGVGRKTANVVLGVAFGVPGWTVDTHVQRLSKRLGFSNESDPEKIEYELQKVFPNQDWSKLSITMIWHGRRTCFARKPNCEDCPVNHLCPSSLMPA